MQFVNKRQQRAQLVGLDRRGAPQSRQNERASENERKEGQMESSRKRDRAAGGGDTASAEAPDREEPDRVTLHVGGETFVTCRATLEPASSYFARRFSAEWSSGVPSEDCFLDRDADSFRVLLSFMRCGHVSVLPRDPALFSRVLLDAEYFGIDSLIEQVKVKVQRHLHSKYVQTRIGQVGMPSAAMNSPPSRPGGRRLRSLRSTAGCARL